jgi:hypothetical protein
MIDVVRLRPGLLAILMAVGFLIAPATANAAPAITNLSLRGLTIGKSVTLVINGSELSADTQVILPVPIASQTVKGNKGASQVTLDLTIGEATSPGIYLLRVATKNGVSNPLAIGIDRLPQEPFAEAIQSLPVALSGALPDAGTLRTSFQGKQGDVISLDLESQRLGAAIKPVLRLLDARGKQLAYSPPLRLLQNDARLTFTLPSDGTYQIELHDQLYRPANPNFFRLKVGPLQFGERAFPLAVTKGTKATIRLLADDTVAEFPFDASSHAVPHSTTAPVPAFVSHFTGAAPRVLVSDIAEQVEPERENGQLPKLTAAPVGVSGVLTAPGEEDRYELPVTPGQKLRLEVFAQRHSSPLDAVLTVYGPKGNQLQSSDDRPGSTDPMLDFTVPAGVNTVHFGVRDMQERGGPQYFYRLEVRDAAAPNFALSVTADRLNIPAGGTQVLQVQATRFGYDGPIDLNLPGLPSNIAVHGNKIAAGASIALVTLTAQPDAAGTVSLVQIIGTATELPESVARFATTPDLPGSSAQPHLTQQLAIGVMRPSPIQFAWNGDPADALLLGDKLPARLTVTRQEKVPGNVKVRLLTTQPTPKKTVKVNNQDRVVDDVEATLRLDGEPQAKPDQQEITANILVPASLPRRPWDLVLIADLLAADNKTVVSSIATPVRTLSPLNPLQIELTSAPTAEGKAGAGETGKLTGKIERVPAFKRPIVVTLENLPKGYSAPQVFVPADQNRFELSLTFPFGSKPTEIKDAKLIGLSAPVSVNSVRSNAVSVNIKITPGEKPSAERPLEVFEDDEKFVALLTEGSGRAVPENRDKFSGQTCLRINGDQKFATKLPNLGIKVRENPGPGEVRYIRFAWKKQGGNTICLQLNHDSTWGPGGSGREGAKFRYHAGPGSECYGGAVVIDSKIPTKFEVVTRDLFADFGEFTLDGLGFSAVDGQAALFDHIYLGRSLADFELLKENQK